MENWLQKYIGFKDEFDDKSREKAKTVKVQEDKIKYLKYFHDTF